MIGSGDFDFEIGNLLNPIVLIMISIILIIIFYIVIPFKLI